MKLDEIDWDILDILQGEGRIGFRELGRRIGLSAPAAAARVHKMEDAGIIAGYRAVIDHQRIGLRVEAFVQMAVSGSVDSDERVIETARGIPEIIDVWRVTGRETYLLRVVVPVVHDLERVLRPLWQYGETITGAVLSSPLAGRPITRSMASGISPTA
jgi:Lrp/AsnC family leucine-responsive transcriptional regulator